MLPLTVFPVFKSKHRRRSRATTHVGRTSRRACHSVFTFAIARRAFLRRSPMIKFLNTTRLIARRPAGPVQECRRGLARPAPRRVRPRGRHHEMPDDGGRTRSAAIAACARLRRRPKMARRRAGNGVWSRFPGAGSCPVLKAYERVREPRARPVSASDGPGKVDQMVDPSEPVRWRPPLRSNRSTSVWGGAISARAVQVRCRVRALRYCRHYRRLSIRAA